MTKAFNDKERLIIKDKLMQKGKELFSLYGLKKTGIGDLTKEVGIAQGTFYNFFESKEELYFEIMEKEHEALQSKLFEDKAIIEEITKEGFKEFLMEAFEEIDKNPILKSLYVDNEYEIMLRKLPEEKLQNHLKHDEDMLTPLILHWQGTGRMINRDPKAIAGLFRALFTVTLHKKEIGENEYKDTIELLIELIANGLILEGRK